jgi:hypothetical protein
MQQRYAHNISRAAARPVLLPLLPCRPPSLARSRQYTCRIQAAAAAVSYSDVNGSSSASWQSNKAHEVAPLPAPPTSGQSLTDVLPYLFKLALSEKQLKWRLGAAFACMLASKAAGEQQPCNAVCMWQYCRACFPASKCTAAGGCDATLWRAVTAENSCFICCIHSI